MSLYFEDMNLEEGCLMKNYITRRVFSLLSAALLFFSISTVSSYSLTCMPTCSATDGRFLSVTEGAGFATLTPAVMNIRIVIPAGTESFQLGIFDGDALTFLISSNWDTGFPTLFTYTVKIDPDEDNNGPPVFEELSTNLPNNAWADFTLPTHNLARNADGDFVYTLTAKAIEPLPKPIINPMNIFQVNNTWV
jgi:hypothetical protein